MESLKKNYQFRAVYNRGKSVANRLLVIYALKNGKDYNRLGFSVSKKVGKSVVRSRVTRLIKENFRLLDGVKSGYDIVVIARVGSSGSSFDEIKKAIVHLIRKLDLGSV